ncbi:MAG TPA: precorrin-3B C(17)-methyltransferase [Nitrososphaera sp.]|nr:precorrin-3B C(17)-methyltransferase [Nitrososphaera sp.]
MSNTLQASASGHPGKINIIGFGPGALEHLTFRAKAAIEESQVIIGYRTYVLLVKDLIQGKKVIATGMREEVKRAQKALEVAQTGRIVGVVSSGDAGVYGMAGLIYEVLTKTGWKGGPDEVGVEVIPGVTALCSVAALVGAPLVHDFASISLSDLLTPLELILKRVEAAASADYVIGLYNPKSGRRTEQIVQAQQIISKHRKPTTPVAIVKSAFRDAQKIVLTDLEHMLDFEIGMLTTIIIGNSATFVYEGRMVTPRGYESKYALIEEE